MRVPWALLVGVGVLLLSACMGGVVSGSVTASTSSSYSSYSEPYSEVSASVSLAEFDEELSPYGQWVYVAPYGRVWRPYETVVGYDFQPYVTGGSWVYTDAGWQFESQFPFGWATFHYGRWANVPGVGWSWIPGTEWAPAWVSWRYGGDVVGWAPLGPNDLAYEPSWVFFDTRFFASRDPYWYRHRLDYHRAYPVTRPVAPARRGGWAVGPPPQNVARATGQPVPRAPVVRGRPPPGESRRFRPDADHRMGRPRPGREWPGTPAASPPSAVPRVPESAVRPSPPGRGLTPPPAAPPPAAAPPAPAPAPAPPPAAAPPPPGSSASAPPPPAAVQEAPNRSDRDEARGRPPGRGRRPDAPPRHPPGKPSQRP